MNQKEIGEKIFIAVLCSVLLMTVVLGPVLSVSAATVYVSDGNP